MTEDGIHNRNSSQHQHNDLYHWVYVFGATFLVGIMDFAFFWKDDHLAALLILASWVGLISVYELYTRHWSVTSILGFILGSYAIAGIAGEYWPTLPEETSIQGHLIPDNIATPLLNCTTKENDVSLILGTSAYTTNSKDKFPVFRLGECAPLYIRKTDDGLSVDFDMYTPRKDLISRFLDNDWNLVTSEFSYQKHPDRSTLQVFDKKGNELFFIRYLNSKVIWMRGAFSCGTQDPIIVSNESVTARSDNFIMGNIVGAPGSSAKLVIADSDESAML